MLRKIHLLLTFADNGQHQVVEFDAPDAGSVIAGLFSLYPDVKTKLLHERSCSFFAVEGEKAVPLITPEGNISKQLTTQPDIFLVPHVEGDIPAAVVPWLVSTLGVSATTAGMIVIVGNMLISMAVNAILAPKPETSGESSEAKNAPSFVWNGAFNVNEQGGGIPLLYGVCQAGTYTIAVDADSVNIL